jgi:hypothetical protein
VDTIPAVSELSKLADEHTTELIAEVEQEFRAVGGHHRALGVVFGMASLGLFAMMHRVGGVADAWWTLLGLLPALDLPVVPGPRFSFGGRIPLDPPDRPR